MEEFQNKMYNYNFPKREVGECVCVSLHKIFSSKNKIYNSNPHNSRLNNINILFALKNIYNVDKNSFNSSFFICT